MYLEVQPKPISDRATLAEAISTAFTQILHQRLLLPGNNLTATANIHASHDQAKTLLWARGGRW